MFQTYFQPHLGKISGVDLYFSNGATFETILQRYSTFRVHLECKAFNFKLHNYIHISISASELCQISTLSLGTYECLKLLNFLPYGRILVTHSLLS